MNIERVSKYILTGHGESRRVLLSLPRVKWLEAQPDYTPWPPLETKKPEPTQEHKPERYTLRPQLRNNELSVRQRQAWALHLGGATHAKAAEVMGCSPNAVGKLIAQAREKLGVGLG